MFPAIRLRTPKKSDLPGSGAAPADADSWLTPSGAGSIGKPVAIGPLVLVLMLVLLGVLWFADLGSRSLISPDEGRYASIALEMARSGDWITPRLNGLIYFEKPVMQYWIGALAFLGFGVSEFSARLWPALSGFLTLLMVGYTAARLWGRESGIRALAIAASMTWVVGNSHFLTLDAGLTFFLTVVLCAVLLAEGAASDAVMRRRWIWLAWAAMAGAVLSKGLVGVAIPAGVLFVASLWRRDASLIRGMHWWSGLLVLFALATPWFVLVSMRNPIFAQFFFVHEHFARYLTTVHQRQGAWWYYVPLLLGGMLPWTSALPWLGRSGAQEVGRRDGQARDLLVVWCAFVFLFFSASGSKLPSYILPMFPALALLAARALRDMQPGTLRWHLLLPTLVWAAAFVISTNAARFASAAAPAEVFAPMAQALRVGAVVFLVCAGLGWFSLARRNVTVAILCVAFGHLIATTVVLRSHDAYGQLKSAAPFAAALRAELHPGTPVFAVAAYDQTLPFYLGRDVTLVAYMDEFALGEVQEPDKWLKTVDEFVTRWQALPQAAAYINPVIWTELQQRGLPMRVIYRDAGRVVVVKK
ncbi:glycosyltransferase family 39 protein [Variovorax ureilyticus]|uniref:Glycosyltransferase family 39 protein n=1 Tax=Variovorax ureilyticus TaxID=1836198 RepID=A0ABU8VCD1_9BURK